MILSKKTVIEIMLIFSLFVEAETDTVDKYFKVVEDIFILTKYKGHYDMMMGIENAAN